MNNMPQTSEIDEITGETPAPLTEKKIVYVVSITQSSPFKGHGTDITDMIRQIEFKFPGETRRKIGAIRQEVNVARDNNCMKFFANYITSEAGKEKITTACERARAKMQEIDPTLHVSPIFFEVQVSSLSEGDMFESMKQQLKIEVHTRILERIERAIQQNTQPDGTIKPLSTKTKNALLSMLDKVGEINVLGDQDVDARIAAIRQQVINNSISPLRDEILAYINDTQGADALEVTDTEYEDDPQPAAPSQARPQPETDDNLIDL